jgi:trans-aconitate 2-methyltransferase
MWRTWKSTTNHHIVRTNYAFRSIKSILYRLEAAMEFAKLNDTDNSLEEIGYVNRTAYLHSDCLILPNRRIYSKFVKTVVMKPYLEHLSPDNDDDYKLKTLFLELFLDEVEKYSNRSKACWFLDYVRLNIVAHRY